LAVLLTVFLLVSAQLKCPSTSPKSPLHRSEEDLLDVNSVSQLGHSGIRSQSNKQLGAITWGILIMFYISYGCSFIKGTGAFRVPWGLQMIPAIFLFLAMLFLPESPRWLAKKDRWEDAVGVLALVHAHGDVNSPFVAKEMAEIREVVEFERANSDVTYFELFKPKMINRTHIGVFTQIWSQLTGMNVMMCKFRVHKTFPS
jgi:hypothetical protein